MSAGVEDFVTAKELGDCLRSFGAPSLKVKAARKLIKSMQSHGMPVISARMVRPSDAYAFLTANPDWRPYKTK